MKIFISQGYSYDPEKAYELAKIYSREVAKQGHIPISPVAMFHGVYCNDTEYQRVIFNCFALINDCQEVWVFDGEGESQGVCVEIAYAEMYGKPVKIINNCPLSGQNKGVFNE